MTLAGNECALLDGCPAGYSPSLFSCLRGFFRVLDLLQIMTRHRLTHSAYDNLVSLLLKDFSALDDPSIPMPGGGIGGVGGSLGNLSRDFTSAAGALTRGPSAVVQYTG